MTRIFRYQIMYHRKKPTIATWSIIILILNTVYCIQFAPLLEEDITQCAFVLTSVADYSTNLLQNGINEPVHCITYDAINQAYVRARNRIELREISNEWKTEDVAIIGEFLLDISIQIANLYDLSPEDVEFALPQVDTSKTLIRDICPAFLSTVNCKAGRYRRFDGLCNNLKHPSWGATMTPFTRLMSPHFSDHISLPRKSVTGNDLPSARIVSRAVHPDEGYHDHASTVMIVAWGQFMDHDFTLMGTPLDKKNRNEPEECCYRPDHLKNRHCMEISIPEDDYFYQKYRVKCQDFVRAFPAVQPDCKLGPRNPFNTLTAVIDGNTIYGVNEDFARYLRSGVGGQMRMNPVFSQFGLKDLLPMKTDIPDEGCIRSNSSQYCFLAGEIRVNEQLVLTCIHTLMAREHNRIAAELSRINPHWDDELLYQETRRIVIAEIQHITFNEFLPLLLGKDVMEKYGIQLQTRGYWDGYDAEVNPNIMDAFSSAAFRFGHSLLPSANERWSKSHRFIASKRLSELIRKPYDLYRAGVLDEYFVGLINQVAQAMDDSITQEVTNHLIQKPGNYFGLDLVSFNIQRGRDFGLPGYMHFRKHCGLETADDFTDMFGFMSNSTVHRYMSIYEHPNDIDLWSGGVSEKPLAGSMLGPTFACIIATQMNLIRKGDRFWYELPDQPSSFAPEQLQEIRKVKLSRILCDNSDLIDTVQLYPMVLPDHEINRRVSCKSSILPSMNLQQWADTPSSSLFDTKHPLITAVTRADFKEQCPECDFAKHTARLFSPTTNNFEYHAKTLAIIDGSRAPPVSIINLFKSDYGSSNFARKLSKRSAPLNSSTHDEDKNSSPRLSLSTNLTLVDISNDEHELKNLSKRHSIAASKGNNQMTQAIMKGVNEERFDVSETSYNQPSDNNNNHRKEQSENYDIENIFRKNVPIYDGFLPRATNVGYTSSYINPNVKNGYYFENNDADAAGKQEDEEKQDAEEEDDDDSVDGLINVHDDHDAQYEYVPMDITEDGKQITKKEPFSADEELLNDDGDDEEQAEEERDSDDKPKYRKPESHQHLEENDEDAESPSSSSSAANTEEKRPIHPPMPGGGGYDFGHSGYSGNHDYNHPAGSISGAGYDFSKFPSSNSYSSIHRYPSFGNNNNNNNNNNFNFNKFQSNIPNKHSGFSYPNNDYHHSSLPVVKYPNVDIPKFNYPDFGNPPQSSYRNEDHDETRPVTGTSHQYNSLADNRPHYYNHHHRPTSAAGHYGSESAFSETDFNPKPRIPSSDFVPKRANLVTPAAHNGRPPYRTTYVPNSLEEYHQFHNNNKAANVPKDDESADLQRHHRVKSANEEEEEEEQNESSVNPTPFRRRHKTALYSDGEPPKSFMTLSFGPEATEDYTSADDDTTLRMKTVRRKPNNDYKSNNQQRVPGKYRDNNDQSKPEDFFEPPTIKSSISSKNPARSSINIKRPEGFVNVSAKRYRYRPKMKSDSPTVGDATTLRHRGGGGNNDRHTRGSQDEANIDDSDLHGENLKLLERVSHHFGEKIVKRSTSDYDEIDSEDEKGSKENVDTEEEISSSNREDNEADGRGKDSRSDASVEESSLKGKTHDDEGGDNSGEEKHFWEETNSESYFM